MSVTDKVDLVRQLIERLAQDSNETLKAVSLAIGKNETYLQQFVRYGKPQKGLPEDVREALGRKFGLAPDSFREGVSIPAAGRPAPPAPPIPAPAVSSDPRLDEVVVVAEVSADWRDRLEELAGDRRTRMMLPRDGRCPAGKRIAYLVADNAHRIFQQGTILIGVKPEDTDPPKDKDYVVAQVRRGKQLSRQILQIGHDPDDNLILWTRPADSPIPLPLKERRPPGLAEAPSEFEAKALVVELIEAVVLTAITGVGRA